LLEKSCQIPDILRIRFMTSHPKDLSANILKVMAENEKISPHLHLPVQSGSDRILERMKRQYTRAQYLILIENCRRYMPEVSITSDVMVGFPGETASDFQDTVNLMKEVEFDEAYTYRYSPRPGTEAAAMESQLSDEERLRRLDIIIQVQRRITHRKKKGLVGQCVEVLPEAVSKRSDEEWMGRTPTNHVVVFPKAHAQFGRPVEVLIEACQGATLRGMATGNDLPHRENHGG
jgi:tRNA-2-methylthio-N6-dimethylallyladenosine synthase